MARLAWLAIALACTVPRAVGAAPSIRLEILSRHAPAWLEVACVASCPEGSQPLALQAASGGVSVAGAVRPSVELPRARWRLRGATFARSYEGALRIEAVEGRLAVRLEAELESYVAAVVSAESLPGTPPAALEALAIVARSWALAAGDRHDAGGLCDLAHCLVMAGQARPEARAAARATAGRVLRLADGRIAQAPFHASCGGHTADPAEIFGGPERTGAAPVADPACAAPWEARLPRAAVEAALAEVLGGRRSPGSVEWRRGAGGYVVRVVDPADGRAASGEAFMRAAGRRAGWSLRSPRFAVEAQGDGLVFRGRGHGHGVGLCQEGASRLAAAGADAKAILARYFPGARIGSL